MKGPGIRTNKLERRRGALMKGFSLPEVLVAVFLLGFVVIAFYTAFTQGTVTMRMAREDLRATQILVERSEALRLTGWDKLPGGLTTFPASYDPSAADNLYAGSISIVEAPMAGVYGNNLKQATIRLDWKTGKLARKRELTTFIARYGLQTYVD